MPSRIAICLFEELVTDFDISLLMGGQPLTKLKLQKADSDTALYLKNSHESTPEWVDILKTFSDLDSSDTITASSGAILFVKANNRIMACCFGTSVANINKDNIERDFGLAVAYHRIPKKNYKSIETYSLTENPITNNKSAAMPSSQNTFNLDSYLETITELSGNYWQNTRNTLVKGKEFFSILAPLALQDIKKLCVDLVTEYDATIMDVNFKKLTAVSKIKTKKLIDFLNDKLCQSLTKKEQSVYVVDYQQYEGLETYSLTPKGEKLTELEIGDVYKNLFKGHKFTTDYLKTKRVTVYDRDDQMIDEWSLYKCLFAEFSLDIGGHILYKGNWYEVQKRYLTDLKDYVARHVVDASTIKIPAWDKIKKESAYNIEIARAIGGQCWDKILYTHPDYPYGIEFCDVLLPQYIMHVKKLSSSALNSHLLMQTYVSAQLLRSDLGIRKWIKEQSKKHFKKNIFLKSSNEFKDPAAKYLILLMAGTNPKSLADSLPFFSLISFNMMIRRLTQLDFTVEVCKA